MKKEKQDNGTWLVKGYVGEAKGISRVLVERGFYRPGMRGSLSAAEVSQRILKGEELLPDDLDANLVLSRCEDFVSEMSALEEVLVIKAWSFARRFTEMPP